MSTYNIWTDIELNFLKDNYNLLPAKELAKKINRSEEAVFHQARKLKIIKLDIIDQKDIDFINDNYLLYGAEYCAKYLNCSVSKVLVKSRFIGKRFERLYVLGYSHKLINNKKFYKCICDCGKYMIAREDGLRSGNIRSCGCLNKEMTILNNKKRRNPTKDGVAKNALYSKYKYDAKNRNYIFDLTTEEFF